MDEDLQDVVNVAEVLCRDLEKAQQWSLLMKAEHINQYLRRFLYEIRIDKANKERSFNYETGLQQG